MRLYFDQTLSMHFTKTDFYNLWLKKRKRICDSFKYLPFTHYPLPTSSEPLGILQTPPAPCGSVPRGPGSAPSLSHRVTAPLSAALPASSLGQVPLALHTAERVIISKTKSDRVFPLFKIPQWFSVAFRIK